MKKLLFFTIVAGVLFANIANAEQILLYGGKGHNKFLGCLTCNQYDSTSIWNEYGTYGSQYNTDSIWNEYGTYGSEYSNDSPWNEYAQPNVALVDKKGNFYGYFTCNKYAAKRNNSNLINFMCEHHSQIKDHLSEVYDKIFN